ncbi:hypothetical protein MIC448_1400013 [Microbacterium sp. C448]|nr:hypothetical protein MIC448_1400013 [Microbacterium sp. C448]
MPMRHSDQESSDPRAHWSVADIPDLGPFPDKVAVTARVMPALRRK